MFCDVLIYCKKKSEMRLDGRLKTRFAHSHYFEGTPLISAQYMLAWHGWLTLKLKQLHAFQQTVFINLSTQVVKQTLKWKVAD